METLNLKKYLIKDIKNKVYFNKSPSISKVLQFIFMFKKKELNIDITNNYLTIDNIVDSLYLSSEIKEQYYKIIEDNEKFYKIYSFCKERNIHINLKVKNLCKEKLHNWNSNLLNNHNVSTIITIYINSDFNNKIQSIYPIKANKLILFVCCYKCIDNFIDLRELTLQHVKLFDIGMLRKLKKLTIFRHSNNKDKIYGVHLLKNIKEIKIENKRYLKEINKLLKISPKIIIIK